MTVKTNPKILIVEDESIVAFAIEETLKSADYEVMNSIESGENAIKYLENEQADAVLMDIRLSGNLDGITTAQLIRDRFKIPVIFLTAYSDSKTLGRAKVTEPYGYIVKPFKDQDLLCNLEMALYKHEKEKSDWENRSSDCGHHTHSHSGNLENIDGEQQDPPTKVNVCLWCKDLQEDHGDWKTAEEFISEKFKTEVWQIACNTCFEKLILEVFQKIDGDPNIPKN